MNAQKLNKPPHTSVMVTEFLSFFEEKKLSVFFEGTVGAGGHAKALLEAHPEISTYIGCDKDPESLEIAQVNLAPWQEKVKLFQGDFAHLDEYLRMSKIDTVDGFFFDLGVSSMQLDRSHRGFSFSKEGPLDMRMDPNATLTAEQVINTWSEKALGDLFREYGEERNWKMAAGAIVHARKKQKIKTTTQLADVIMEAFKQKRGKLHPATLIFQALRICVNKELDAIGTALAKAIDYLSVGGRVGVISFHSLEDRIVKNVFKGASTLTKEEKKKGMKALIHVLTKKPLQAAFNEIRLNPRARSAKMRFAEKM